MIYLHGIQSHPGWFVASAASLARSGFPVYQLIRRGSAGDPNPPGDAPGAQVLLDDVSAAGRFACDHAGAEAFHLLGVSWGGKLAAAWAMDHDRRDHARSLTLICPGIAARTEPPLRTKLAIAGALLARPGRRFDIPLEDPGLFTDNPPMREFLRRDPGRLHRATARFFWISRRLDIRLSRARAGAWGPLPAHLILAADDRIIDNARCRQLVERLSAGRGDVRVLPGCHTLEFEPDRTPLVETLRELLARAESGTKAAGR